MKGNSWAASQFDSVPQLGMHVGIWLLMFGAGYLYALGMFGPQETHPIIGVVILAAGGIIGGAGQLATRNAKDREQ